MDDDFNTGRTIGRTHTAVTGGETTSVRILVIRYVVTR